MTGEAVPEAEACVIGHLEPKERDTGLVCRPHYHLMLDHLRQIDELFPLLPYVVAPSSGSPGSEGGGRGGKRADPPAPVRLAAVTAVDRRDPDNVLTDLEDYLAIVDHHRPLLDRWIADRKGRAERERDALLAGRLPMTTVLRCLRRERRWICAQTWVRSYAESLETVHRNLATAIGDSMWPTPIGKCPNCQVRLYAQPSKRGIDEVTCRRCKTTWRGVHLARLRLIHEQEAKQR